MTYRVYQWASGTVGRHAARVALARPQLELVGLHVMSAAKVDRLVSELLDCEAPDLRASNDIGAVCNSSADVVIHAPLPSKVYGAHPDQDLDDICTLLAAGKNVITVVGYMYPKVYGAEVVGRLQAACEQGGSTFHSTGLNPGWMGDLIPLTMSALAESIEHIHVLEISNFQHYPSPEIMFESMGFGSTPEIFRSSGARRTEWLNGLFAESVQMVADGIGLDIARIDSEMMLAEASEDLDTAAGLVPSGTVAGQHWRWAGCDASGAERMVHETVWRMHESVAPDWAHGKHAVRLKGQPNMHLEFSADYVSDGLLATAMHAVNAIPQVVAAPPGIQTLLDLSWITPR